MSYAHLYAIKGLCQVIKNIDPYHVINNFAFVLEYFHRSLDVLIIEPYPHYSAGHGRHVSRKLGVFPFFVVPDITNLNIIITKPV